MEQKTKKRQIFPATWPARIVILLTLFVEAAFILMLMTLDVLPDQYLLMALGILVIADAALWILLSRRKKRSAGRICGIILSLLLCAGLGVGAYYLYVTYDTLAKISGEYVQVEKYHVVVLEDGAYQDVEDIRGKNVYVINNNSKMYAEAEEMLRTKVDVHFMTVSDASGAGEKLVSEDGTTHEAIIFLSQGQYDMIREENKAFKKNAEILYTVKVPVKSNDSSSQINVTEDPFTLYISGSDSRGEITEVARSDVNMLVTVNPKTHTVLLTSMPRDSYVPLHMNGEMDKLTHTGVYGIDESIGTIEDWLGVDIDFYARVGFNMVRNLVDAVDGIDVYSETDFESAVTIWKYKKGINHLNGKQALAFARERKAFEEEDQQRIKNQQKVVKALIEKVTGSKTLVTKYPQILAAIRNDMQTDFSNQNVSKIAKMQLSSMPKWTVETYSIKAKDSEAGTWSMGPSRMLFVAIPNEQSVKTAKQKIQEVMYPAALEDEE